MQCGARGLQRITLPAVRGQKREANIHIIECVALDDAAHAHRCAVLACRQIQAEAVFRVLGDIGFVHVGNRIIQRMHVAVADIADPVGVSEQRQKKRGIIGRDFAQNQAFRFYFNQRKLHILPPTGNRHHAPFCRHFIVSRRRRLHQH